MENEAAKKEATGSKPKITRNRRSIEAARAWMRAKKFKQVDPDGPARWPKSKSSWMTYKRQVKGTGIPDYTVYVCHLGQGSWGAYAPNLVGTDAGPKADNPRDAAIALFSIDIVKAATDPEDYARLMSPLPGEAADEPEAPAEKTAEKQAPAGVSRLEEVLLDDTVTRPVPKSGTFSDVQLQTIIMSLERIADAKKAKLFDQRDAEISELPTVAAQLTAWLDASKQQVCAELFGALRKAFEAEQSPHPHKLMMQLLGGDACVSVQLPQGSSAQNKRNQLQREYAAKVDSIITSFNRRMTAVERVCDSLKLEIVLAEHAGRIRAILDDFAARIF